MSAKHTPGPWHVIGSRKQKYASARFIRAGCAFVGKTYGHEGQPADANARLIAAAPAMLEALQACREYLIANPLPIESAPGRVLRVIDRALEASS